MAKISAGGAVKMAEARRVRDASDIFPAVDDSGHGYVGPTTDVLALCSDGRILGRTIFPAYVWPHDVRRDGSPHVRHDSSGWRIVARVKSGAMDRAADIFGAYAARRGYTVAGAGR